jgi:hypothetical protein
MFSICRRDEALENSHNLIVFRSGYFLPSRNYESAAEALFEHDVILSCEQSKRHPINETAKGALERSCYQNKNWRICEHDTVENAVNRSLCRDNVEIQSYSYSNVCFPWYSGWSHITLARLRWPQACCRQVSAICARLSTVREITPRRLLSSGYSPSVTTFKSLLCRIGKL